MEAFKRELAKGSPNSSLLYNLGNACFKAGRLGEAILYYERAARLAPRDEDIQDNLALARLAAVDRFIEPPRPWPVEVFVRLHRRVTANEVAVLAAGLWWAVGLAVAARCAAVARRRQRAAAIAALVAGILLLPAGLSLAVKLYNAAYVEQAIVVVEEAELRTGPGASFGSVVTLHEGAKLTIQERRGVWVHGRMQTGGEGWVQSGHIETI
jgi:tetratricopeptide (TPR) repeat protein